MWPVPPCTRITVWSDPASKNMASMSTPDVGFVSVSDSPTLGSVCRPGESLSGKSLFGKSGKSLSVNLCQVIQVYPCQ